MGPWELNNKILYTIIVAVLLVYISSIQEIFAEFSDSEITLEGNFNILEKTYENGTLAYDYFLFSDETSLESSTYTLMIDIDKIPIERLFDFSGKNVKVVGEVVTNSSIENEFNLFLPFSSSKIKIQSIELSSSEKISSLSKNESQTFDESQFNLPIGRDVTPKLDAITILAKPPNNPL